MTNNKIVEFTGKVVREVWSDNASSFRIVALDVDAKEIEKLNLKRTKYGNVCVKGIFQELGEGLDYQIKAEETMDKNGYAYKVLNIIRDKPKSAEEMYIFLKEILTQDQARIMYEAYPDIVQRVIDDKLDDIDLSKTCGIKEARFEVIKRKIIENYGLAELVIKFKGLISMSMIHKLYKEYSSVKIIEIKLKEDPWKCLSKLDGVGFKTADAITLELEKEKIIDFDYDLKASFQRCLAACIYLLKQNESDGNTQMDLRVLRQQIIKLVPACSDKFVEALKDDSIYYDKDKLIVAIRRTYDTEKYIAKEVMRRLSYPIKKWDFDISKYINVDGISLSDEQQVLLTTVCNNNFTVLTAAGGTGKSFSTKALINMFDDNDISYILASPTGKAAKKLSEYTGRDANTIHRTLCYQQGKFEFNKDNQLETNVIIIDEIGMTDINLFSSLLEAIPDSTRIVLIGDKYQLNSVGCGALLRDLISSNKVPQVNYSKVFRMGEGGVLTACTYIRNNQKYIDNNQITHIGTDKSYVFIPVTKDNINTKVIQLYKKLLETHEAKDITVISSYNVGKNGCDKLNTLLQPIANPNAKVGNTCLKITQNKLTVSFYVGDSVIQNVNNYHAKLYYDDDFCDEENKECLIANGEQGKVVKIINNSLVIDFDGSIVWYSYSDLQSIKHAFALSTHKMQGSQNKIVLFCCPSSHIFMSNNNILYTAISRAEKQVYHFSDEHTLNVAMKKSDSEKRQTMLRDLLK